MNYQKEATSCDNENSYVQQEDHCSVILLRYRCKVLWFALHFQLNCQLIRIVNARQLSKLTVNWSHNNTSLDKVPGK